jgi:hypothetical protein
MVSWNRPGRTLSGATAILAAASTGLVPTSAILAVGHAWQAVGGFFFLLQTVK